MNQENNEIQKRKDYYFNEIQKVYVEANKNFDSSNQSQSELIIKYDDGSKEIIKEKIHEELLIKLHTLEIIATDNISQEIEYLTLQKLIKNKKAELLEIAVENEWLTIDNWKHIIDYTVRFHFNMKFCLSGGNVTYFNQALSFLNAVTKLKSGLTLYKKSSIFGFYVTDSLRLYIQALFNLHPNLGIWKDVSHLIMPINDSGWLKIVTLYNKNFYLSRLKGGKLMTFLTEKLRVQEILSKRLVKKGEKLEEIHQTKGYAE